MRRTREAERAEVERVTEALHRSAVDSVIFTQCSSPNLLAARDAAAKSS
jgi:hypothetical protein